MTILTIRTDNPQAEVGLYDNDTRLGYETWQAHRQLGATIHQKIADLLKGHGKTWSDITGIVAYEGPGSFTGLRIGLSVANALIASYDVPAAGATGDDWVQAGISQLQKGTKKGPLLPQYGAPVHTTLPKK